MSFNLLQSLIYAQNQLKRNSENKNTENQRFKAWHYLEKSALESIKQYSLGLPLSCVKPK